MSCLTGITQCLQFYLCNGYCQTLHEAAHNGDTYSIKQLLRAGHSIDRQDDDGDTALIISARRGFTAIVELLLERSADKNIKNNSNETAQSVARTEYIKTLFAPPMELNSIPEEMRPKDTSKNKLYV
ncbi:ankyrin repeat domain-containing protein [Shewanella sp. 202IG2-18]|uniref:ankyrin repeat domain-containing protein n=1 Tax=Parashewanella hymeniacidonis TaxID=2807618 RepID=UPI00195F3E91|nr:ankyrin repeat domain-containing protein [Parashewanella hymeniacidonis]MBM7074360.1 ankyrin repeat domain-containing protein [Parashewanella hymeniacidonis]